MIYTTNRNHTKHTCTCDMDIGDFRQVKKVVWFLLLKVCLEILTQPHRLLITKTVKP